jgi:hypothetical protein
VLGHRPSFRLPLALATGLATVASLVVMGTMSPAQALAAPTGLNAAKHNESTTVLSWSSVRKASGYEVQVDTNSGFGSPDFSASTVNTKVVPTVTLPAGTAYWRVRSVVSGAQSGWSTSSFTVSPVTSPVPLSPVDGAHLQQPQDPPLLQWSAVQGASSYTVQVDGDVDMIGASSYTTKGTSLVVPDPLTTGDWYWTVTANKGNGLASVPSAIEQLNIDQLPAPHITYPVDDINQTLEDVVLDWSPVPGAKTYDLQVALDQDFNNIALSVTNIQSTRYSPPTTLNSDQFWWRVRAVDLAGQQTPWVSTLNGFKRVWPDAPQAVYPLGPTDAPAAIVGTKAFYQWTPAQHASEYQLQVSTDPNFSPGITKTCTTAQTTYTPRVNDNCAFPTGSTVFYWRVRPIDLPYPSGLPGIYSDAQAFTYTPPAPPVGGWDPNVQVTGLKIGINGTGATTGDQGCAGTAPEDVCTNMPTTPVLSWDPVPGAGAYLVYYGQDANFTTSTIPTVPVTNNTIFQLRTGDSKDALPDSQAGSAYYWHIRPCTTTALTTCAPDPVSSASVLPDTRSFRKASPAVTGLSSTNPNASEITFGWDDFYNANVATSWNGETSNQTARSYRIQVDDDSSFASPLDTQVVDQATYTEYSKLYPDGTYYWRVQALDDQNQGLTWSSVQSFTKTSPTVSTTSPVGGASVPGTTPFRWAAAPYAASYSIEVYRNNDVTLSSANRVLSATVKTTAYVPPTPLPASGTKYLWRVRRTDASNNPGPWSAPASFFSTGAAPTLVTPKAGVYVKNRSALFEWTQVPGAASYSLNLSGPQTSKFTTVATAYAPTGALADGAYSWSVTAYDAGGAALGTSATRSFKVDGTAPIVVSMKPQQLKPSSTIKAVFSERVKGVSHKTMRLYRVLGKKKIQIDATVTVLKHGKVATLDPKPRLKAGNYLVVFIASKIKDLAGNTLAPSQAAPTLRSPVRGTGVPVWVDRG